YLGLQLAGFAGAGFFVSYAIAALFGDLAGFGERGFEPCGVVGQRGVGVGSPLAAVWCGSGAEALFGAAHQVLTDLAQYWVGVADGIVQRFQRRADVAVVKLNLNAHLTSVNPAFCRLRVNACASVFGRLMALASASWRISLLTLSPGA